MLICYDVSIFVNPDSKIVPNFFNLPKKLGTFIGRKGIDDHTIDSIKKYNRKTSLFMAENIGNKQIFSPQILVQALDQDTYFCNRYKIDFTPHIQGHVLFNY